MAFLKGRPVSCKLSELRRLHSKRFIWERIILLTTYRPESSASDFPVDHCDKEGSDNARVLLQKRPFHNMCDISRHVFVSRVS